MTINWNPTGDFAAVVDGCQTVTIRRRGAGQSATVTHALRRPLRRYEIEASCGRYVASDTVWHFPAAELSFEPRLGDYVVDSVGQRWTLLQVTSESLNTRWRCVARNLIITHGLNETVRHLRATWRRGYSGAALPEWREMAAGVAARVQPAGANEQFDGDRVELRSTHRVFVAEPLEVQAEDLIVDAAERIYRVVGEERGERIDQLQVLLAIDSTGVVLLD